MTKTLAPNVDRTVPYRVRVERRKRDLIARLEAKVAETTGEEQAFWVDLLTEAEDDFLTFIANA